MRLLAGFSLVVIGAAVGCAGPTSPSPEAEHTGTQQAAVNTAPIAVIDQSVMLATEGQATCYATDTDAGRDGQTALDAYCGRLGGRIYITQNLETGCWNGSVVCYGTGSDSYY